MSASGIEVESTGVVTGAPAMFPSAVRTPRGTVVVAFATAPDGWPGGEIGVTRSTDGGRTWSDRTIVAGPRDGEDSCGCAVGMVRLADGTLLLPYNGVRWTPGMGTEGRRLSLRMLRSDDDGVSWSGGERIDLDFFWPAVYGQLLELADGEVLWPVWGRMREEEKWRSVVLSSTDGGDTWRLKSTIAFDPDARMAGEYVETGDDGAAADGTVDESVTTSPDFRPHDPTDGFSETSVCMLADGRLLAVLRQQGVDGDQGLQFFRSVSEDQGATWSPYEPMGFAGMSPALWTLTDGRVLLASRRVAPEGSGIEPALEVRVSADGLSWGEPLALLDPLGNPPTSEYQVGYPAVISGESDDQVVVFFYSFDPAHGRYLAQNVVRIADA